MHSCERCGKESTRHAGGGHYYCSPECAKAARLEKHRDRSRRGYLYVMGADGKRHGMKVNKRPRPGGCELCHRVCCRLHYHHWNDAKPEQGIWVCIHCHGHVEAYERGLIAAYLKLKRAVNNDS